MKHAPEKHLGPVADIGEFKNLTTEPGKFETDADATRYLTEAAGPGLTTGKISSITASGPVALPKERPEPKPAT